MRYLGATLLKSRSLAYVLVGKDGALIDSGGALSVYGLENLRTGEDPRKKLLFLDGFLPLEGEPVFLPRVKTESGLSFDIHLFPGEEGEWVLLLDATLDEARERLLQQCSNELGLLRRKLAKLSSQQKGATDAGSCPSETP